MGVPTLPARDQQLVQIVNAALADSARRSGAWLACKPGCSQCCVGVFAINQLDALRLEKGMAELSVNDPDRHERIRTRARAAMARFYSEYPGDPVSGVVDYQSSDEARQRWDDWANDEPCP